MSWAPLEGEADPTPRLPGTLPAHYTMLNLARGYDLRLMPARPQTTRTLN
ncbi:hypothetical protein [Streptomyces chromofuscus]|nr:hypothetical protein [Streptomyces chromofuscus]GGT43863.1 hypothetical protein GCM10010254_73870 [Streptomyces chromofuscus]